MPEHPIDKAATCAMAEQSQARQVEPDYNKPLPVEVQGRIVHYALLAASSGPEYQAEQANAVIQTMSRQAEWGADKKWFKLVDQCHAEFPAAGSSEASPALPADPIVAAAGCDMLAKFMNGALGSQGDAYIADMGRYSPIILKMNGELPKLFDKAGVKDIEARLKTRREAMAAFARLGSPIAVLNSCVAAYGEKEGGEAGGKAPAKPAA